MPSQGVGGNGIASEFGDLTGMLAKKSMIFCADWVQKSELLEMVMLHINFLISQQ